MSQVSNLTPIHIVLDLEVDRVTNDIDRGPKACITQMGVVIPSLPKTEQIFDRYIIPPDQLRKPYWKEKFANVPFGKVYTFEEAWPELVRKVNQISGDHKQVIVIMHNDEHDWNVLKTEVARYVDKTNLTIPKHWRPLDTFQMKNHLKIPGIGSVTGLCHTLGLEVLKAHDAVNDALMTNAIFEKMVGDASMEAVLIAALDERNPAKKVAEVIQSCVSLEIIVYDFETDRLFPKRGESGENPRAVQLAMYLPSVGKVIDERINPGRPIPRVAASIHGIRDQDVAQCPDFKAVWLKGQEFIASNTVQTANKIRIYLGHNIWDFDDKVYKAECERTGLLYENLKSFDTLWFCRKVFQGIVNGWTRGFFKLEYLSPLLGINVLDAHNASCDVAVNWELFKVMIDGLDPSEVNASLRCRNPVVSLSQKCLEKGKFNPRSYFDLYTKACNLTTQFAEQQFSQIKDKDFFLPRNLACFLDINVKSDDPLPYTLWRIFLKLSEGIDRKAVNDALRSSNPLGALEVLCEQSKTFNSQVCLEYNKLACDVVIDLAKSLFPGQNENFFKPERLAKTIDVKTSPKEVDLFDRKRVFLKLTEGLKRDVVNQALKSPNAAEALANLVREFGIFEPDQYAKPSASIQNIVRHPKRKREESTQNGPVQSTLHRFMIPPSPQRLDDSDTEEEIFVAPKRNRLKKLSEVPA